MRPALDPILKKDELTRDDIITLLDIDDPAEESALFERAYEVKQRHVGTKVYFRGLIELSNICVKNCFYCGIRRGNRAVDRYALSEEEVLEAARFAVTARYGSVVIQSGERQDDEFICYIERLVGKVKEISDGKLGITLSLGEQSEATYRRWYAAGAHRYLLRIETSNAALYKTLHPDDHSFEARVEALRTLYRLGYQVGTGVMIGLPGQTTADLADDIAFFKKMDVAMIGMGPFIPHHDTPLADAIPGWREHKELHLRRALRMIAVTRIQLRDINIASTTALQAIDETGREMGLLAGANIIMPNLTDTQYRTGYQLYDDKPCMDENATMCAACLERRITSIGETVGYGEWGDSPHFLNAKKQH
ncbi:MAG TPA: [FeFe] hydrogenase H-cluster radical SAM maturase HydE [bacterium]|nr:[FeFe] hydrogenase H-cluster radical SAM maturase HydE [bacterium]